tara:strand:+ start:7391 stop:7552 length:162 start_codon:yes stop_codon:yes gene_type:complete
MVINNIFIMPIENPTNSFRQKLQNNIFKFILISIFISMALFLVNDQGFFFGIH